MIDVLTYTSPAFEVTQTEHSVMLEDGTRLFYRAWIPREPTRKSLVLFHRGHEHSGRLEEAVRVLALHDIAVFAWDARGHGRSSGQRGYARSFGCLARDADEFVRHISDTYGKPLTEMIVLGHSVGAVTVAAWAHDYAPAIRAMVLVTPALRVRLYVPFARVALRLAQWLSGRKPLFVSSYVKGRLLTHDASEARRYDADPLISRAISVNVLLGLHDTGTRLISDAAAIQTPVLVLAGGSDWVVDLKTEREFFERLGSRSKRMRVFEGMYHDLLHETDSHLVLDEIRAFVRESFSGDPDWSDSDEGARTLNEYHRLCEPLPLFSPKRLWFAAERFFLKTVGRLSEGVRIGWRTGFDSGSSLDYVYQNRARGALFIGRIIDRVYLNSVGWAGIRQRKRNLEKILGEAINRVSETALPVRILDVAAGQARYILDTLASSPDRGVTALLRDFEQANVESGRALAAQRGISGVTFERADAFDPSSYESIERAPHIFVVSGLFELFPDNALPRRCLEAITRSIEPGGYLIYTGQPWHPQIEMIARVLTNRGGAPWIMRRRTQPELDALVREAGFTKIRTMVDKRGVFTVSIARKLGDVG